MKPIGALVPTGPAEVPPPGPDCRDCGAEGVTLHQRPRAIGLGAAHRVICARCVGDQNREHVEATRRAVRDLKAAAVRGLPEDERDAMKELTALIGEQQAATTVQGISERSAAESQRGRR